jgi:hypothetical protein
MRKVLSITTNQEENVMKIKTVTATIPNDYDLSNFSMECACGKVYSFTQINEKHKCSCGRLISISEATKARLVKTGVVQPVN